MTARSHRRRDRGNKCALYWLKSEAFKKEKNKEKNSGFVQQISAFLITLNEYYDNLDAEKFNR